MTRRGSDSPGRLYGAAHKGARPDGGTAMYVIQREDGQYVSRPGSRHSYARKLQDARIYETEGSARADLCPGNEKVLTVAQAMQGLR